MDIKITGISKLHSTGFSVLQKGLKAKVGDIEELSMKNGEKYGKFLLAQGKSTVYAFAFGKTYELWKKALKIDKMFHFPSGTFSYKPKYLKRNSNSTCKHDMTFLQQSRPTGIVSSSVVATNNDECDISSLPKVSQLLRTAQTFTRKLKSIKLSSGEVYRYMGCKVCNYGIPRQHTDGKYYCKGSCNNKMSRRRKIGIATERKICFTIRNVKLAYDENVTIESVVVFNPVSESLLQRRGEDFDTDNEAKNAWSNLTNNYCFDITLKRNKKKKDSKYPPTVFVHSVDKVVALVCPARSTLEPPSELLEYACDAKGYTTEEKEEEKIFPNFPQIEMKLQYATTQFRDSITKYQISSKPPGLVLLINNFNFPYDDKEKQRLGSEVDIGLLERAFRVMGFEIYGNTCQMDIKTGGEFGELLSKFRAELIVRDVASFFIVISSHGRNNQIELPGSGDGSRQKICVVKDLMIPFSDKYLPQYQGRPKVFMPITCQNLGNSSVGNSLEFLDNKLFDMLVCCPAFPGFIQFRITTKGSLFVHCLVDNLMKYATTWHLLEILDQVQSDMKKQIQERNLHITVSHYLASTFGHFVLVPKKDDDMDID